MIVIDTDVLSATLSVSPDEKIVSWLDAQRFEETYITSVTLMEVVMGIEVMDAGKKRETLDIAFATALRTFLRGRVLPFDEHAALIAGRLYGARRKRGLIVGLADTQIAAITLARGATLATGNVRHFSDLPIPVVNPWNAS
jgi:toxin FitB